ncbi:MAG: 6,7-dimethyl-8-ribityllumazine synthase [Rhodospirillaceae bacterium]|jgi:6,7-dimethyl-8-ribityllumazine synthase|nr:6,7-dimethyl-8-ribityllumazine synthase [Rhodospirillaceae bacterium]MBT5459253.1 6,7-dimethyl-8-ribityllumazine synthase [Rhodospirillaceae bacterium]
MSDAPHIMIVESRYYEEIAEELITSVITEIEDAGATYERFEVPGAFEIPTAIKFAIRSMDFYTAGRRFDGYIALGCVIRGQTTHYDYVCQESARALQDLSVQYSLALGYGILTVENREQAMARARRDEQDRGGHAARACLKMIEHKRHFRLFPR